MAFSAAIAATLALSKQGVQCITISFNKHFAPFFFRAERSPGLSKRDPNSSATEVTSSFPPSGNEGYMRNRDVYGT